MFVCVCVFVRTMAKRPFLSSLSWSFLREASSLAKPRGSNLKSPGCVCVCVCMYVSKGVNIFGNFLLLLGFYR